MMDVYPSGTGQKRSFCNLPAGQASIEVRIRHLLFAHHEDLITDDECQDELAILRHRAELLHPIPIGDAVAKMAEVAGACPADRHG